MPKIASANAENRCQTLLNKSTHIPLQQFLALRLLLLGCVLSAFLIVLIPYIYNSGLDDSAEFYLINDAKRVKASFENKKQIPESDSYREVYLSKEAFPKGVEQGSGSGSISESQGVIVHHWLKEDWYHYGVVLPLACCEENLVVVHRFNLIEDELLPGLDTTQITLLSIFISLVLMLLMALWLNKALVKPTRSLAAISERRDGSKGEKNGVRRLNSDTADNLKFEEFAAVADELLKAMDAIEEKTEKEKLIIKSLSHELRTPLAIVSAALDILDLKDIDPDIQNKIAAIRKANTNMTELAHTLLAIWQKEDTQEPKVKVLLREHIQMLINDQCIAMTSSRGSRHDVLLNSFQLGIDDTCQLDLPVTLLNLVLNNLIRNALQHGEGLISISGDETGIQMTNLLSEQPAKDSLGLGLYLAEQAANHQGWQLTTRQQGNHFMATLSF